MAEEPVNTAPKSEKRKRGRPRNDNELTLIPKQIICLQLVGAGLPQVRIAQVLGVSANTVSAWMTKLNRLILPLCECQKYAASVLDACLIDSAAVYLRTIRSTDKRLSLEAARDILVTAGLLRKSPLVIDTPLSPAQIDTELKRILAPLSEEKGKIEGSICPPNIG